MKRPGPSPGCIESKCERPAQFPDDFISLSAVKWTRRQALAVEASRTVGDALMQLPRHCRVSPPAPTHTHTHTPTPTPPQSHKPARSRPCSHSLSLSLISSPGAFTLTRQQRSRRIWFGFIYLSAEPRGDCHHHKCSFYTTLAAASLSVATGFCKHLSVTK